jgi:MarR family transcriptional regulator, temperature-dependent positive regulator of motility
MVKAGKLAKRVGPLGTSPSHLMHRALQLALDIYSEETGPDGLTQRQFAVLEAIKTGLTQTELVRMTGIDRSTLADLVTRMTAKGLLERERSTLDARAKAVRLSTEGAARLEAARPLVEAADKRIMALLPKGQRETFLAQLAELAAAADAAITGAELLAASAETGGQGSQEGRESRPQGGPPGQARQGQEAESRRSGLGLFPQPPGVGGRGLVDGGNGLGLRPHQLAVQCDGLGRRPPPPAQGIAELGRSGLDRRAGLSQGRSGAHRNGAFVHRRLT